MDHKLNKKNKVNYQPGSYFDIIVAKSPVPADSREVMQQHYKSEVSNLETQLTTLNVLENAKEIALICKKIIDIKKTLAAIADR